MASVNSYLKSGKYWKQDIVATQDTAQTTSTSFITVVDITGEALVSSATITTGGTNTVEARMTRDGDVFTEQLVSAGGTPTLDLIAAFEVFLAVEEKDNRIQAPAMYCKTSFKFEVRHVSGTVSAAIGTVDYTTGSMENV